MKVRRRKLIPRGRIVGLKTFWWACKNRPKSKRGWYIVKSFESGYDEHNSWETFIIRRFK